MTGGAGNTGLVLARSTGSGSLSLMAYHYPGLQISGHDDGTVVLAANVPDGRGSVRTELAVYMRPGVARRVGAGAFRTGPAADLSDAVRAEDLAQCRRVESTLRSAAVPDGPVNDLGLVEAGFHRWLRERYRLHSGRAAALGVPGALIGPTGPEDAG